MSPRLSDFVKYCCAAGLGASVLINQSSLQAQGFTVVGEIRDSVSQESLIGASLLMEGTSIGSATNDDGFFILKVSASGAHRVIIEVCWDDDELESIVTGEAYVMVTSAVDEAHARAALEIFSTPDALLTLVLGGDHLTEGIKAIQTTLNNPILRPHYAYIEAKRLAERFGKRKANIKAAAQLIDDSTVMSPAEIKKAAGWVKAEPADNPSRKKIA